MASNFVLQVEDAKESLQDLSQACRSAKMYQSVIEYLLTIYRKVQRHSKQDYDVRRLMKNDPGFRDNVWRWSAARDFLETSGWVEVSESLILPSYVDLTKACALLEKSLQPRASTQSVTSSRNVASTQSVTSSRSSTSSMRNYSPKRRGSSTFCASNSRLRSYDEDVFYSTSASSKRPSATLKRSSTGTKRPSTSTKRSSTSTKRPSTSTKRLSASAKRTSTKLPSTSTKRTGTSTKRPSTSTKRKRPSTKRSSASTRRSSTRASAGG